MTPLFGTAGNPDDFYDKGHKSTLEIPAFLSEYTLTAYEYQCTKGLNVSTATAVKFGEKAREYGITLSIHTPYYISLSSTKDELRENSIRYILESAKIAEAMGAKRIIVHSGSTAKIDRETALEYAKDTMEKSLNALDKEGLSHIIICPETMGKINQLGTVSEVAGLCKIDERLIPTIDFGHINARTLGGLKTKKDFEEIFNTFENDLGFDRIKNFHSHFSKIEYTEGGEKRHLTFEDTAFGPDFDFLAEIIYERGYSPTIICESRGTQAKDALIMKNIYEEIKNRR